MSSLIRSMKRKRGWISSKPYDYCRRCKIRMGEKPEYGYVCSCCGRFKPFISKEGEQEC